MSMLTAFPVPNIEKDHGVSPGLSTHNTLNDNLYNGNLGGLGDGGPQKLTRDQMLKSIASWLAFLVEGIDLATTMILIPVLAVEMKTTITYSAITLASQIVGRSVGQIIAGNFVPKLGFKTCSIFSILFYTAALVLTAFTHDIKMYMVMRFVGGVGLGAFGYLASVLLKANVPPADAAWVGRNSIQFPLGYALIGVLLLCGLEWNAIFWILAPLPIIFGAFLTMMWNHLGVSNLYLNRYHPIICIDATYQPLPSIVPYPLSYLINHNLMRFVYCFFISFLWLTLHACWFGLVPIYLTKQLQLSTDLIQYTIIGIGFGGALGALTINLLGGKIASGKFMGLGVSGIVAGSIAIALTSGQWQYVIGAGVWIAIMAQLGVSALHKHLTETLPVELYSLHTFVINFGLLVSPFVVPLITYISARGPIKGIWLVGAPWAYFGWGLLGLLMVFSFLQGLFLRRPPLNYPISFPNSAIVTYNHVANYSPRPPTMVEPTPRLDNEAYTREIPMNSGGGGLAPPTEETATRHSSMRVPHPIYQPEKLNKTSPTWSVHSLPANLSYCEYLDPLLNCELPPQQAQSTINLLSQQQSPEYSNNPFLVPGQPVLLIPSPTPMAYTFSQGSQYLHPSHVPLPISPHPMSLSMSQSSQRTSYHPYMIPLPLSRVASECPSVPQPPIDPTQVPLPTSPILQATSVIGLLNSGWSGLGSFFVLKPAEPTTTVSTTKATPVVSMETVSDLRPLSSIPKRVYES